MAKKAVAKAKKNAVTSPMSFEGDSNAGMENIDADSIAIPFLKILQKMSPICDEDREEYLKGAKPGKFFNTVSEVMSDSVILIPCHYERKFNEWVDIDSGGGFKGSISVAEFEKQDTERDDHGHYLIPDTDNYYVDTRYHYCLLVDPKTNTAERVVFSLSSTQLKTSRKWMSKIANIKMKGANGMFTPPSFSHKYEVTTISQENAKGTWKLPVISTLGALEDGDELLYADAKKFFELVNSGKATVSEQADDTAKGNNLEMGDGDVDM